MTIARTVYRNKVEFEDSLIFNHVVEGWLRFDVLFSSPPMLAGRSKSTTKALFDRDNLTDTMPERGAVVRASASVVSRVVPEFLRVLALLPVALGRGDYVVAASGSTLLRMMLIQLMVEAVEVEERGGALSLARLLDHERYRTLQTIPPIEATRESAVAVHRFCAAAFFPLAEDLCSRTGFEWPADLELAVRTHLGKSLDGFLE